jgi:chromate transporter
VLVVPLAPQPAAWALVAATVALSLKTKIAPVWLIAVGAVVGAFGWV